MVNTRRGQDSLEYLMTYGIAIAIVVIAIAALYSMGVFSGGGTTTTPPCTPCFNDFAYNAHTANSTHLTLELKNGMSGIGSLSCTAPTGCSIGGGKTTVDPNSIFTVIIPGNGSADVNVTLSFKKDGSTLTLTRDNTISASYFNP